MSNKEMKLDGTEKGRLQRSARRQTNNEAAFKDGDASEPSANPQSHMDFTALAKEITSKIEAIMEEKMTVFSNKLDAITAKIESESRRLNDAECRISSTEDGLAELEAKLTNAEKKLEAIAERLDDQEARARRDNIRIFGVKEGIEGRNALAFFETWLPKILNLETAEGRIRLDRCHRSFGRPKPGVPRAVIMKLHYPADKMKILALSVKHKIEYEGSTIAVRQDFPQKVIQQRRTFNDVCQKLIAKNVRFRMRYPATLFFTHNNKEYSFNGAAAASVVVNALDEDPRE